MADDVIRSIDHRSHDGKRGAFRAIVAVFAGPAGITYNVSRELHRLATHRTMHATSVQSISDPKAKIPKRNV